MGEVIIPETWSPDLHLVFFDCVRKYKSVNRAYKRGNITALGQVIYKHHKDNIQHRKAVEKANRYLNQLKKEINGRGENDN